MFIAKGVPNPRRKPTAGLAHLADSHPAEPKDIMEAIEDVQWRLPIPTSLPGRIQWLENLHGPGTTSADQWQWASHDLILLTWLKIRLEGYAQALELGKDTMPAATREAITSKVGFYETWVDRRFQGWAKLAPKMLRRRIKQEKEEAGIGAFLARYDEGGIARIRGDMRGRLGEDEKAEEEEWVSVTPSDEEETW